MPTIWHCWVLYWAQNTGKKWQLTWGVFCPLDDGVPAKFDSWDDATICVHNLVEQTGYEDGVALKQGEEPRRRP